jgi:predicted ArsR family transcriptional regulator
MARSWTFLTSHAHVLLAVSADPQARVADIAGQVGLTPRATLNVLADLEAGRYLERAKEGRRTHYRVLAHRPFRHPGESGHEVDELLELFHGPSRAAEDQPEGRST